LDYHALRNTMLSLISSVEVQPESSSGGLLLLRVFLLDVISICLISG